MASYLGVYSRINQLLFNYQGNNPTKASVAKALGIVL